MKLFRNFLYLIALLLLLEVCKTFISKQPIVAAFFIALLISCIQFLMAAAFFVGYFFLILFTKYIQVKRVFLFSWLATLFFFIIAECLLTGLLYYPARIPPGLQETYKYYYDYLDRRVIQFEKGKSVFDPELFYTLKPNTHFNYKNREFNNEFFTNSKGLRDDESSLSAPSIICLGDSYALGWGVNQTETYSEQLEKIFGLKVLNAAVSSYGTARETILLNRLDTSGLHCIIIQYCSNDITENLSYINNNFHLQISSAATYDTLLRSHELVRQYFPGKHFLLMGQIFLKKQLNKIYPLFPLHLDEEDPVVEEKLHAELFLRILMKANLNFKKTKLIVMMLDCYNHLNNRFLANLSLLANQKPYKDALGENLTTLDVSSLLTREDYFLLDPHIRPSGHAKIAHAIWQLLQKE